MFYIAGVGGPECLSSSHTGPSEGGEALINWQCNAESAFLKSFSMLLTAEWPKLDIDSLKSESYQTSVISYVFAIVIGIFLLNILIAVVSSLYSSSRLLTFQI